MLVGKNLDSNILGQISNIKVHPKYDFAIGQFIGRTNHSVFKFGIVDAYLGKDIRSIGFNSAGKLGNNVNAEVRLFKGNVIRYSNSPLLKISKSIMELSFPSLEGFSGSPVLDELSGDLLGMLYYNQEYNAGQLETGENKNNSGMKHIHTISKIVDMDLSHTIEDIKSFLKDLNFNP